MECFKIENLSFTYPKRKNPALYDINLSVNKGEFITLCGKSGCGKTTLLRLLKPSLSPFGALSGNIFFKSKNISEYSQKEQASQIGFVLQNPDNQIVTDKVWHELAFGLESLGYSTYDIRARVSEMASFFGIQNWFYKKTNELSGGQKQLLNLASVMVMQPSVLILDEPTSQLDPIAASEFIKTLEKINRELGTTVILTEHRLEDAFSVSDRIIVMDNGRIISDASPKKTGEILKTQKHPMYYALPVPMRVYGEIENGDEFPLNVREGRNWIFSYAEKNELYPELIPEIENKSDENNNVVEMKDVWFRYGKNEPDVIKGLNLKIKKGELFSILGGNGTGKTTAISLIGKLNTPYRGKIYINGEEISKIKNLHSGIVGMLPQNPQSLFVKNTVSLDLMDMLSETNFSKEEKEIKVKGISELCCIEELLESHPYDLSGGEQQRAALAKVLLNSPKILILDEPTKGLDAHFKIIFSDILKKLKEKGVTVIIVSHDIEFCAQYSDRCAMFFDGNITSIGNPREFFKGKSFYTTSANRMARTIIDKAVLCDDIIIAFGKKPPENNDFSDVYKNNYENNYENNSYKTNDNKKQNMDFYKNYFDDKESKKLSKRTVVSIVVSLIAIPLTVLAGVYLFDDRKYYFISLLIMLETFIPFFSVFERRKPQAREIVVISVMCGIAVAGRTAFFMLPQFKPVVALVIIAGVALGGETGFLIGAVTGFVSNFFFGQGPWTPWQMFAFGIIGLTAGLFFRKDFLKKNKILLSVFGFIVTVFVYGGIMNPASVIMMQNKLKPEMIISSYAAGFMFDIVHALSTAFFLFFISGPMIEKLERIKIKYGLIKKQ